MRNRVSRFALLAIALVFAVGSTAFGGENADAVVTLTSSSEVSAGPGDTISVALSATGAVGVKQIAFTVQVSDASAFEFSVYDEEGGGFGEDGEAVLILEPTGGFLGANFTGPEFPDKIEGDKGDKIKVAFAKLSGSGVSGDRALGELRLVTSSSFTSDTEVTITVFQVELGQTANDKDVFGADDLGLAITVNPPAPPVTEPTLTANSDTDVSLDYGDSATFAVSFTDASGEGASGQAITWTISNNGSESVELGDGTKVAAGSDITTESATDSDGDASVGISSDAEKGAGTTSVSLEASTSASNSEDVSRDLEVEFSATWDVPVPAELASFAAEVTFENEVILHWGVASQSNNLGWEVYRGLNESQFQQVGELIPGDGTTDQFRTYSFTDLELPQASTVYYYLRQIDLDGSTARSQVIGVSLGSTLVSQQVLPVANELRQNFPNPFNPETTISFDLDDHAIVSLQIYDVTGQLVRELINGESYPAGRYERLWDGKDNTGVTVGSGLYLYRIQSERFTAMRKMVLLK
jgi:hypothetical protein